MNNIVCNNKKVYILLSLTLIIDAINGFLMSTLNIQFSIVGVIFRIFLLLFFLYSYSTSDWTNTGKISVIILYIVINIFGGYFFYNNDVKGFIFDITESTRLLLSIIITFGLIDMINKKTIKRDILVDVIYTSVKIIFWVYLICFVTGIGKSTYGDAGYKAIFNANNGLTITLIVLFIFQIERTYETKKIIDIIYTLFLLIALFLLGAKSSYIFIVFYFIMKLLLENKLISTLKYLFIAFISILVLYYIISIFFKSEILDIINRQLYFLDAESDSLITFFLSGRDEFLQASMMNFKNNFSLHSLLFGFGSYYHQIETANILGVYDFKNIEMDLFDIIFSNGLIGVLLTYGVFIHIFMKNVFENIKLKRHSELISFICIIIFSITGGHVFTDAMASTYLAIVTSLIFCTKQDEGEVS